MGQAVRVFEMVSKRDGELVAEGAVFSTGKVVVCWMRHGFPSSVVVWDSLEDARQVHEGVGSWEIRFV